MPEHRSKKCLFGHTFHMRPKKVLWSVVESDFSVSLCPFSKKRSKIKMDKELDNTRKNVSDNPSMDSFTKTWVWKAVTQNLRVWSYWNAKILPTLMVLAKAFQNWNTFRVKNLLMDCWRHFFWYFPFKRTVLSKLERINDSMWHTDNYSLWQTVYIWHSHYIWLSDINIPEMNISRVEKIA